MTANSLFAQPTPGLPTGTLTKQTYTSPIDGAAIEYALWLPPNYEGQASWPMIVFLHGSGQGTNWKSPTEPQASVPVLGDLSDLPFIVAFPLMRGSWSISALAERDVLDTIAAVKGRFPVDPDRVHLVGLSLGGFAGWRIACRYPDEFASLTVFCGGGEPDLAVNLRNIPLQVCHGASDPSVPVSRSREMVAALEKAAIPVNYAEYPQGKHIIWREALGNRLLYQWMVQQVRDRHPRRISYRTNNLRYASAYWATVESILDPSAPAYIDVFAPPGQDLILVHADNVGRLVLDLPPQVLDPNRTPSFMVNDKPLSPRRTERGWVLELGDVPEGPPVKRPGLSGPIQDVLNDVFVVSIPSQGEPEELRRWQEAAIKGMGWLRGLVYNGVRFAPAEEVSPEIMHGANLICFGTATNNPVLGQLAGEIPLRFEHQRLLLGDEPLSAWAVAFAMIYPNPLAPDRYIVVCSGRPDAAGKLARLVLTPPPLSPPLAEDLVVMLGNGQLVPWGESPSELPEGVPPTGARNPGRGPVFDNGWRLDAEARQWLHSIPNPPERAQSTQIGRP